MLGFVLQPTYRIRRGHPVVHLYGRLESGAPFLVEDDRRRPFFYVRTRDAAVLDEEVRATRSRSEFQMEPWDLTDFYGELLLRVSVGVPGEVPPLRDALAARGVPSYEADVRFASRFLMDHGETGIRSALEIRGTPEEGPRGLQIYRNPELRPAAFRPTLRVLSLDLETTLDASEILSAALVQGETSEVLVQGCAPVEGATHFPDERSLILACAERVAALDPDVLTGWNVVDFDLMVLDRRAQALGVRLRLGRNDESISFQQDRGFTRQSRAVLAGRMVIDAIGPVRDALRLSDYRLETVAQAVLGRGKLIDHDAPNAGEEIQRLYREDPAALVAYNREDARLVLEILEHEGLVELLVERSLLSGMPLDRVGASIASFDNAYLPELHRRGIAAPSVDPERKSARVSGGAVLDSAPGIFRNVAVFDFKSLYPSLMRTFQLDPLAHARAGSDPDPLRAPNGALFARDDAILPEILERFMERREAAKTRKDRHADQAIKIMMNSLFGVLGAASCRFFDPAVANAITTFGQQTLAWTREAFESRGVDVIYGDTDSLFVALRSEEGEAAALEAEGLRVEVENAIAERIQSEYRVPSKLVLELERIYSRFFMPRVRRGSGGSKKRYAGLTERGLDIVGLESVRRDWPALAGRLQRGMLDRLFRDEPILPFVAEIVCAMRSGEMDEELVYVKRVRKGLLENYKATNAPHIQAARKAGGTERGIIRYVITERGPEPTRPGTPLPEDIDRVHYLEKVLRPIAESILQELGESFDDAAGLPRQLTLL